MYMEIFSFIAMPLSYNNLSIVLYSTVKPV